MTETFYEHDSASRETFEISVADWRDLPSSKDLIRGYISPDLSAPNDERVQRAASQLPRPRYVIRGIEDYRRELMNDSAPIEIKAGRLKALAEHHGAPILTALYDAKEQAANDIAAIEEKRKAVFAPANFETQQRYSQIRNELGRLERSQQISAVFTAVGNNDRETLAAISTLPHSESVCPLASYQQAKQAFEKLELGADVNALADLKECHSRLAFAAEAFRLDLLDYNAFKSAPGRQAFSDAMGANFENGGEQCHAQC